MLHKFVTLLTLFVLCSFSSVSQKTVTFKPSNLSLEQKEKENQIRNQAILLLKNNLSGAKSIPDLKQRADVVADAAGVLWDYDKPFASEGLSGFINQSLSDYTDLLAKEKKQSEDDQAIKDLDYALKKSIRTLTSRDISGGSLFQSRYFKIKEESLKAKNLNEELALAADGIEVDEQRTLSLLTAILQQHIPSQFPKLIFDLKAKNPNFADILVQRAIQNLATNPNYTTADAIYLSTLVFNEQVMLIPVIRDETIPNAFGVFNYPGSPTKSSTKNNMLAYITAIQRFFALRLSGQAAGVLDSKQNLIRSYFLLQKLTSYARTYSLVDADSFSGSLIPIATSMQTAGFTEQTLADVQGYANRLATTNNPLGLDDGTNSFDKADNAKTPEEKMNYLIDGVIGSIESRQFSKLEWRIEDIQNPEIRESLNLLLNMRAGLYAIEKKDWGEFEKRAEKISNKRIKAFLYLKAVSVLDSRGSRGLLMDYVIRAEKNINDIPDKTDKASAKITLASFLLALDNTETMRDIPTAIFSVNDAPDYAENQFEIKINIPTRPSHYAEYIGANSFKTVFAKLAESDWTNAQVQALQVKRNGLQAIAQIAAAKAVLQKIVQTK